MFAIAVIMTMVVFVGLLQANSKYLDYLLAYPPEWTLEDVARRGVLFGAIGVGLFIGFIILLVIF